MDDLLTGAETVKIAAELQQKIHRTLENAHFPLRKYMSNSEELLSQINSSLIEKTRTLSIAEKDVISLLGLYWQPIEDAFFVKLHLKPDRSFIASLTKWQLLSEIARVFDPIAILAPVTIRAKSLLQEVWRENRQWDDLVSSAIRKAFLEYYNDLENLDQFSFRRCYSKFERPASSQLTGFCDASERAYAAVVYLRSIDNEGNIDSYIVSAKPKLLRRVNSRSPFQN